MKPLVLPSTWSKRVHRGSRGVYNLNILGQGGRGWSENEENTSASNVYGPFAFKLPFRSTIPIRQCCLRNISKFIR